MGSHDVFGEFSDTGNLEGGIGKLDLKLETGKGSWKGEQENWKTERGTGKRSSELLELELELGSGTGKLELKLKLKLELEKGTGKLELKPETGKGNGKGELENWMTRLELENGHTKSLNWNWNRKTGKRKGELRKRN